MRIIFVRHAEPDYEKDSLTENGRKEAEALAVRTKNWTDIDRFYCSPLGRAVETAAPTLKGLGREAIVKPWLREFYYPIKDPLTGEIHGPWDLQPQYFTGQEIMYDREHWYEAPLYRTNPGIEQGWKEVTAGIDKILSEYGYHRKDSYYEFKNPDGSVLPAEVEDIPLHGTRNNEIRDSDDRKTIVIFCHFGVTCVMLAHLIGVSPVLMWQGTCIAPTGVTVVNAEKRLHNAAFFRIQTLGDCAHLLAAGVPVSGYAAFSPVWQK